MTMSDEEIQRMEEEIIRRIERVGQTILDYLPRALALELVELDRDDVDDIQHYIGNRLEEADPDYKSPATRLREKLDEEGRARMARDREKEIRRRAADLGFKIHKVRGTDGMFNLTSLDLTARVASRITLDEIERRLTPKEVPTPQDS